MCADRFRPARKLLNLAIRVGRDLEDVEVLAASFERNSQALAAITEILSVATDAMHQIQNTDAVLDMYRFVPAGKDHSYAADLLRRHITFAEQEMEDQIRKITVLFAKPDPQPG